MHSETPTPDGVEVVSDALLHVTVQGKTFPVAVTRTFRTGEHFGVFESLDEVVSALAEVRKDELEREREDARILAEAEAKRQQ